MATERAVDETTIGDLEAEEVALRQQMSTVVKMLMARRNMRAKDLLAHLSSFKKQALYDRLNAKKDWEATELRVLGRFFGVAPETFFMDPDDLFPGTPDDGAGVPSGQGASLTPRFYPTVTHIDFTQRRAA